ncbi:hypothetical protein BD413DRAFT_156959 [Trametes elegans]|nr:hypothetical protein BD413DRAFT_156959 [Trametes elegans]
MRAEDHWSRGASWNDTPDLEEPSCVLQGALGVRVHAAALTMTNYAAEHVVQPPGQRLPARAVVFASVVQRLAAHPRGSKPYLQFLDCTPRVHHRASRTYRVKLWRSNVGAGSICAFELCHWNAPKSADASATTQRRIPSVQRDGYYRDAAAHSQEVSPSLPPQSSIYRAQSLTPGRSSQVCAMPS